MGTNSNSLIEREVDRLFSEIVAPHGQCGNSPITGDGFVWGLDPIAERKKDVAVAILAREWFAVNGPPDAPPLPLNIDDRDHFRASGGLTALVGFYARSLSAQDYDLRKHPLFDDFACGLMALAVRKGLWNLENDETLLRRFPPRPLDGLLPYAMWAPPEKHRGKILQMRPLRCVK